MDRDYFQHAVNEAVSFGASLATRFVYIATSGVICMFIYLIASGSKESSAFNDALDFNEVSAMENIPALEDLL